MTFPAEAALSDAPACEALRFSLRELAIVLEGHPADQREALTHLVNHADETFTPASTLRIRMHRTGARGREIAEEGGPTRKVCCDEVGLGYILYRLTQRLIQFYGSWTAVHCGAATIDGRLALFTGDRGAGKTTLLLRLLLDGALFHCDEIVLAHDGLATSLPRRMHVKEGTLPVIPELAEACHDKPLLKHGAGPRFYPIDPTELGRTWRSTNARPAAIFHLTPGFDGPPVLAPMSQIQMVKTLMCQTLSGHRNIGRQAADICSMVRAVPCFALQTGNLADTAALVRRVVHGSGVASGESG